MTRLIDADAMRKDIDKHAYPHSDSTANDIYFSVLHLLADAPTVDAVEVVRCKECLREKHCKNVLYQGENGYCSLGERICDECVECDYYWVNNDTGEECQGLAKPCHEFIPKRGCD